MIWFLIILSLILVLIGCLLVSNLNVIIEYREKRLTATVKVWFFRYIYTHERIKYLMSKKKKPPRFDPDKPMPDEPKAARKQRSQDSVDQFLDELDRIREYCLTLKGLALAAFKYIRHEVYISDIKVNSKFGTGEASQTGIIHGAVWALIADIYAVLASMFYVEFPQVELEPVFNETVFEIGAEGIIRIRIVHIITAVLRRFKEYHKHKSKEM